jgi:superfamily II DNA/RNA helicase
MKGFHVLPIYGGQSYDVQLRPLKRGVHAVVGTPGRVMDHIKRVNQRQGKGCRFSCTCLCLTNNIMTIE